MNYNNITELYEALKGKQNSKRLFSHVGRKKTTYNDLITEIDKLHVIFQNNGLTKGQRVILSVKDEQTTAVFFLAFLTYGITAVLIDPDVPCFRAVGIIKKTNADGFIMDEELFSSRKIEPGVKFQLKIKKAAQKKGVLFKKLLKKNSAQQDTSSYPAILDTITTAPLPLEQPVDTDIAYILFTSGTSAEPKGVMINYKNLFTHLTTLNKVYDLDKDSQILNILMMYHVDGPVQGPILAAFNQATWIRPFSFEVSKIDDLFNSIYKYKITHFITVPTILSLMNKFNEGYNDSFATDEFKAIISVASKLESKLWQEFENTFKTEIVNVYGLTESVTGSLFSSTHMNTKKIGTAGKPIDCEVKILDDNNNPVEDNSKGVLWLKGDHISPGYFDNEAATKEVFIDGWMNTGDVAMRDSDGFIAIVGREKNTINAGGVNIYPEQVSEIINTHPNTLESIALGINNEDFGEKLVAAVVTKPNTELSKIELLEFLRPQLEQNQIPKEVFFFDDLPKGLSKKIQINAVKTLINQQDGVKTTSTATSYEGVIIDTASKVFGVAVSAISINDDSNSIDGWDSMGHLNFVSTLEENYGVKFSTAEMMTMNSLKATRDILTKKLN